MAVRKIDPKQLAGGYMSEEDLATGNYPYSRGLYEQGYTYTQDAGWMSPTSGPMTTLQGPVPQTAQNLLLAGGIDYSMFPKFGQAETGGVYPSTARITAGGRGFSGVGLGPAGQPSGFQPKQPIGTVSTQRTAYTGTMPTLDLRGIDKRRVKELTQKAMAPRLRLLRTALNRALVQSYENPNVRRMIVRGALQGYGQDVETARAGAENTAMRQEAEERQISNQNLMIAYNAAMEKYRGSAITTTTQRNIYAPGGAGGTEFGAGTRPGTPLMTAAKQLKNIWGQPNQGII